MLLHFAVFSMIVKNAKSLVDVSNACLQSFIKKSSELFGKRVLVYNVHCLQHLPHFVSIYGPLDSFSMFPYENYLSIIKKRLKSGNMVFEQTINNFQMIRDVFLTSSRKEMFLSDKPPNNCCIVDGVVVLVQKCISKNIISGVCLKYHADVYQYPYPSNKHGIGLYVVTDERVIEKKVSSKCVCYPVDMACFYVVPFANIDYFS